MKNIIRGLMLAVIFTACLYIPANAQIYEDANGYIYYDDFKTAPDAEKGETEFYSPLNLTRQPDGGLKISNDNIDNQYFQSSKNLKTPTTADRVIMEYSIRNPEGKTWRSYAFKLVIGGQEYFLFDQYTNGFRNPLFGEFYVVIDRKAGTAMTYTKSGELKATTDISKASGAISGIVLRHQIPKTGYIVLDYVKMYEANDACEIKNAKSVEPDRLEFEFLYPVVPEETNIADYLSIDNASIESVTKNPSGSYTVTLSTLLDFNSASTLKITDLPMKCTTETINKEIPFTVRDRKTVVDFSLDTEYLVAGARTVTASLQNERPVVDAYLTAVYHGADHGFVLAKKAITTAPGTQTVTITIPKGIEGGRLETFVTEDLASAQPVGKKTIFTAETKTEMSCNLTESVPSGVQIVNDAQHGMIKITVEFAEDCGGFAAVSCFDCADESLYFMQNKEIENQKAEFMIKMDDLAEEKKDFKLYVSTAASSVPYEKTYYPLKSVEKIFETVVKETNDTKMASDLKEYQEALGLVLPDVDDADFMLIARAVIGLIEEQNKVSAVKTLEELRDIVNKAVLIGLKNNGDIEGLIEIFHENYGLDESCYELYTSDFDREKRTEKVIGMMAPSNFTSMSGVKKMFVQAVVLNGFAASSHYSNTSKIIALIGKSEEESLSGFNVADYGNLHSTYSVDYGMTGKVYDTITKAAAEFRALVASQAESEKTVPSGGGGGGGGSIGGGKKTGTSRLVEVAVPSANENEDKDENVEKSFSDVPKSHWAYDAVKELCGKGVIEGKSEGLFCPDDILTREEAAKIFSLCFKTEVEPKDISFYDVHEDMWSYQYIAKMCAAGIMNGVSDESFAPYEELNREMLAAMLTRFAKVLKTEIPEYESYSFADADDISGYAKDSVEFLKDSEIVNGTGDNRFEPKAACTRAEAVKMICGFMKYFGFNQ